MVYSYRYPHPAVAVDVVVFDAAADPPRVLLIRRGSEPFRGSWALPGGFVRIDESVEDAAQRELFEETGISDASLKQLHVFGEPDRDPRERVISIVFAASVEPDCISIQPGSDAADADWFAANELPPLAFDHADMITLALRRAKNG